MPQDFHRWRRFTLEDSPFDPATAAAQYPPDLGLEPIHLNIDLTIDIAAQRAAGVVTHTVVARRAQMRTLTLDAVDLTVTAVGGRGRTRTDVAQRRQDAGDPLGRTLCAGRGAARCRPLCGGTP